MKSTIVHSHLRKTRTKISKVRKHFRRINKNYNFLVSGKRFPAQLHLGHRTIESSKITPPTNQMPGIPIGGLWTSTYDPKGKYKSEWIKFVEKEYPERISEEASVLRPIKNAKIFVIDGEEDLRGLYRDYGTLKYGKEPDLDWTKISKDYDAIQLKSDVASNRELYYLGVNISNIAKKKFPMETKKMHPDVLRLKLGPWDIESTVWFRDVFRKQTPLEIKAKPPIPDPTRSLLKPEYSTEKEFKYLIKKLK